jgi:GMP synthase (glutamine-hydrolysing)
MIAVIDFGSQTTQLIARKIREMGVFAEIFPNTTAPEAICKAQGLILSGGPESTLSESHPTIDPGIWNLNIPILGICYGFQSMALHYGASIAKGKREYGKTELRLIQASPIWQNVSNPTTVWMSHEDSVASLPINFEAIANTASIPFAGIQSIEMKRFGIQFHPEVFHTREGFQILQNFTENIVQATKDWNLSDFVSQEIEGIREKVGKAKVVAGISGGVDSTVASVLVHRAIGSQLHCFFVDHGLLRENEATEVSAMLSTLGVKLEVLDRKELFLNALKGVEDPEEKRKIIGRLFIETFDGEATKIDAQFLLQGTLYPDVIESSGGVSGLAAKIKSHHNVGGLPELMNLTLLEPLKMLFKDEVRKIGEDLGLSEQFVQRHPFPGPGLGIRIIGSIDEHKLSVLRKADAILREEISTYDSERKIWQGFAVLLPIRSVGVMGDQRTYQWTAAIRLVESVDGMTATWHKIPYEVLEKISNRITNEVHEINRVVYDITSKPPGTIEWE